MRELYVDQVAISCRPGGHTCCYMKCYVLLLAYSIHRDAEKISSRKLGFRCYRFLGTRFPALGSRKLKTSGISTNDAKGRGVSWRHHGRSFNRGEDRTPSGKEPPHLTTSRDTPSLYLLREAVKWPGSHFSLAT